MKEEQPSAEQLRDDLMERLQALQGPQAAGALGELAYRRSREALEKAIEEARLIRLQALEDAKRVRESELAALGEALRLMRESAESQVQAVLASAELEAQRLRDQARAEAESALAEARSQAAAMRAEAQAALAAAEARRQETEALEAELEGALRRMADRIGLKESPPAGWLRRRFGRR
jgi:hypothetical protein